MFEQLGKEEKIEMKNDPDLMEYYGSSTVEPRFSQLFGHPKKVD